MIMSNFFKMILKCNKGNISLAGDDGGAANADATDVDAGNDGDLDNSSSMDSGSDGEASADFPDGIDADIQSDPSLKVFIDKEGKINYANLMKSYVHGQKKLGEKGVHLPNEKSSEEDWAAFHNMIRPAELDKYEINNKLGENQVLDEEMFTGFKALSHKMGLTGKQAEGLLGWYNESQAAKGDAGQKAADAEYNQEVETLKEDWGEGFKQNLGLAQKALKEFADEETMEYLTKSGLDGNVKLIRLFNKIGKGLVEDTFDGVAHGDFNKTKEQAQIEINKIMDDTSHAYYNKEHASHGDAIANMERLGRIAYT